MNELTVQVSLSLALVLCAVIWLGVMAKKRQSAGALMKVLAYQSLGRTKGIAAVQVGGEVLLLGVTANDVRLLKTLDGPSDGTAARSAASAELTDKLRRLRAMKDTLYAAR